MSNDQIICPKCGSTNGPYGKICWVCKNPLSKEKTQAALYSGIQKTDTDSPLGNILGVGAVVIGIIVMQFVGIVPIAVIGLIVYQTRNRQGDDSDGKQSFLHWLLMTLGVFALICLLGFAVIAIACLNMKH